jgi:MFS family permease
LIAFVVLLVLFLQIEKRVSNPIIPLVLFSRRQLSLANFLSIGAGVIESSLVFLPILAVAALGMAESTASFMLLPLVLAMSVGSPLAGRFLDRVGSKLVLTVGTTLSAVGMFILSLFPTNLTMFIIALVLLGLGLSALLGAPLRYIMLSEANPEERSIAQGITNVFISIGQLLGSAMIGAMAASGINQIVGYSSGYSVIGFVGLLLLGITFLLKSRSAELATTQQNQSTAAAD